MTSLGGEDGSGDGDVGWLGDVGGSTKVSGDTDVLDDGGETHERDWVDDGGERVGAWLGSSGTDCAGEESDVLSLVACNVLDSVSDPVRVTGVHEVGLGELAQEVMVEVVLEVLERERVLQDVTGSLSVVITD